MGDQKQAEGAEPVTANPGANPDVGVKPATADGEAAPAPDVQVNVNTEDDEA